MISYPPLQKLLQAIHWLSRLRFSIDKRGLAVGRILLWCVLIVELLTDMSDLRALYTDAGILPTNLLPSLYPNENLRSLHSLSGDYRWQVALMSIQLILAVALLVWYHTRIATIGSWALLISLYGRNPIILNGGDFVLKMVLFWAMFLPWWEKYSLDAPRTHHTSDRTYFGPGSLALLIQLLIIYVISAMLKDDPAWISEYSATFTALSLDIFTNPFGQRFREHYTWTQWMTHAVFMLEMRWWILFFIPWKHHRRRTLGVIIFAWFHLGLISMMKIWLFPWICVSAWIMFLPTPVRDARERLRPIQRLQKKCARIPSTGCIQPHLGVWWKLFVLLCLTYVICRNIRTIDFDRHSSRFPYEMNKFGLLLRLDQYRNMFAPYPLLDDGWYVMIGTTYDREQINVYDPNKPLPWEKPKDLYLTFPNDRRRKYLTNLWMRENAQHRTYYANYLCNRYNSTHKETVDKLQSVQLIFMLEQTRPFGQPLTVEQVDLGTFPCAI
jgi:hypothetical protein